jgi:DNA (cytosine-5)-methyltransferase 1
MNPGLDTNTKLEVPLATLSLFSRGGSFDRGLEEGGVVHTRCAVESNKEAVHTYLANCSDGTATFFGSVDEQLARAINGLFSKVVPKIGEVGSRSYTISLPELVLTNMADTRDRCWAAPVKGFLFCRAI